MPGFSAIGGLALGTGGLASPLARQFRIYAAAGVFDPAASLPAVYDAQAALPATFDAAFPIPLVIEV